MVNRRFVTALGSAVLLLLPADAALASSSRPTYTAAQIAQLSPDAQSAVLDPLRAAANAVDMAGRGPDQDVYAGVKLDPAYDGVDLYLTDISATDRVVADAVRLAPSFDSTLVKVFAAQYPRVAEDAVRDSLLSQSQAGALPYTVSAVAADADGSGLQVEVSDVPAAQRDQQAHPNRTLAPAGDAARSGPVAVTFVPAEKAVNSSWADAKWHDGKPFIGGDVLTPDGNDFCTAGIPAVRKSDNRDIMITAGHCFGTGVSVYTGGGATGDYYNGITGAYVGKVISHNTEWDMEELDQGVSNSASPQGNNADESDTTKYIPLNGASYSYDNDFVCQDGALSFFWGLGTPCGIQVLNQDFTGTECDQWGCHNVRGVRGTQYQGNYGACQGDSGSVVFGISGNERNARGLQSMIYGGTTRTFHGVAVTCSSNIFWTEAPDILNAGGLKLNPIT